MSDELFELLGLDLDDSEVADALEDDANLANLMRSLHRLREARRLTQADIAERMGTTQSAVSDLERTAVDPRISTLQRYARAVGASLRCVAVPAGVDWGRAARFTAKTRARSGGSSEVHRRLNLRMVVETADGGIGA